jgi:hypothetical protein
MALQYVRVLLDAVETLIPSLYHVYTKLDGALFIPSNDDDAQFCVKERTFCVFLSFILVVCAVAVCQ